VARLILSGRATAASIIRLAWLRWVIQIGATAEKHSDPLGRSLSMCSLYMLTKLALISTEIFWYLIEVTVALLAVCLPPLSGIRRTEPVERIIRSVQSKLSLKSNRSLSDPAVPFEEAHVAPAKRSDFKDRASDRSLEHKVGILPDAASE
jgi:hypothetical protein